ncbi:MAG TPA: class I SAM-dependent methyltransferase [Bacteroidota bacterium]|nr:class I SAM-dependent methyltransferase [Bacteroidota bacterium]
MTRDRNRVCPVELSGGLEGRLRRWLQNPERILAPYLHEGMTALDLGCGPGFFSIPMARLVGPAGRVIAADLQEGMLEKLREKIGGTDLQERLTLVKCEGGDIRVHERVDFIMTFYMVHEVPEKPALFRQLRGVLRDTGKLLLVEPKLFHVSREEFQRTTGIASGCGFRVLPGPPLTLSWSAVLAPT